MARNQKSKNQGATEMKIYLAARYSRRFEMQDYRETLIKAGHEITSRWIEGGHEITLDPEDPGNIRFAIEDWSDLIDADLVIHFSDEPDAKTRGRGGRHVELGIALALGKPIILVGRRENVFHYLPQIRQFNSFEDALERGFKSGDLHDGSENTDEVVK